MIPVGDLETAILLIGAVGGLFAAASWAWLRASHRRIDRLTREIDQLANR